MYFFFTFVDAVTVSGDRVDCRAETPPILPCGGFSFPMWVYSPLVWYNAGEWMTVGIERSVKMHPCFPLNVHAGVPARNPNRVYPWVGYGTNRRGDKNRGKNRIFVVQ